MTSTNSSTSSNQDLNRWLAELQNGSDEAAERLWNQCFKKLAAIVRGRMQKYGMRKVDEEDVVVDVFASLCRGAERGRFTKLHDQDDLWEVLVMLTKNKLVDRIRKPPPPKTESVLHADNDLSRVANPMANIEGDDKSPEFALELADQLAYHMAELNAENLEKLGVRQLGGQRSGDLAQMLQKMVACRLDGKPDKQIAEELGVTLRTVQRGIRMVKLIWKSGDREPGN